MLHRILQFVVTLKALRRRISSPYLEAVHQTVQVQVPSLMMILLLTLIVVMWILTLTVYLSFLTVQIQKMNLNKIRK